MKVFNAVFMCVAAHNEFLKSDVNDMLLDDRLLLPVTSCANIELYDEGENKFKADSWANFQVAGIPYEENVTKKMKNKSSQVVWFRCSSDTGGCKCIARRASNCSATSKFIGVDKTELAIGDHQWPFFKTEYLYNKEGKLIEMICWLTDGLELEVRKDREFDDRCLTPRTDEGVKPFVYEAGETYRYAAMKDLCVDGYAPNISFGEEDRAACKDGTYYHYNKTNDDWKEILQSKLCYKQCRLRDLDIYSYINFNAKYTATNFHFTTQEQIKGTCYMDGQETTVSCDKNSGPSWNHPCLKPYCTKFNINNLTWYDYTNKPDEFYEKVEGRCYEDDKEFKLDCINGEIQYTTPCTKKPVCLKSEITNMKWHDLTKYETDEFDYEVKGDCYEGVGSFLIRCEHGKISLTNSKFCDEKPVCFIREIENWRWYDLEGRSEDDEFETLEGECYEGTTPEGKKTFKVDCTNGEVDPQKSCDEKPKCTYGEIQHLSRYDKDGTKDKNEEFTYYIDTCTHELQNFNIQCVNGKLKYKSERCPGPKSTPTANYEPWKAWGACSNNNGCKRTRTRGCDGVDCKEDEKTQTEDCDSALCQTSQKQCKKANATNINAETLALVDAWPMNSGDIEKDCGDGTKVTFTCSNENLTVVNECQQTSQKQCKKANATNINAETLALVDAWPMNSGDIEKDCGDGTKVTFTCSNENLTVVNECQTTTPDNTPEKGPDSFAAAAAAAIFVMWL